MCSMNHFSCCPLDCFRVTLLSLRCAYRRQGELVLSLSGEKNSTGIKAEEIFFHQIRTLAQKWGPGKGRDFLSLCPWHLNLVLATCLWVLDWLDPSQWDVFPLLLQGTWSVSFRLPSHLLWGAFPDFLSRGSLLFPIPLNPSPISVFSTALDIQDILLISVSVCLRLSMLSVSLTAVSCA